MPGDSSLITLISRLDVLCHRKCVQKADASTAIVDFSNLECEASASSCSSTYKSSSTPVTSPVFLLDKLHALSVSGKQWSPINHYLCVTQTVRKFDPQSVRQSQ